MQDRSLKSPLFPQGAQQRSLSDCFGRSAFTRTRWLIACALVLACVLSSWQKWNLAQTRTGTFYTNITSPTGVCPSPEGPGVSHSGYIGLRGDSEAAPKRSFFWFFEAEHDADDAPIIMTIGGGPGTSGLSNPMAAQGPCLVVENGTVPNPNRWTEHFNLLALDHPVGVGLSYGTKVNNSRAAAIDVYDFLQKFFHLFPGLVKNRFILSSGSYGGTYVPHIATVIHEQNIALAAGKGQRGAVHINLESMMLSNPLSDATSHYAWVLQTRCYNVNMYNASTCAEMFKILPTCLDGIRFAQQAPGSTVERRVAAQDICESLSEGDTHGTAAADVRKKCYSNDPLGCVPPSFAWLEAFFRRDDIKQALGIPGHVNFSVVNLEVTAEFQKYGDRIQSAYLLYEPLLKAGIRLLHYVGAQDAIAAWPGIISFVRRFSPRVFNMLGSCYGQLKLLQSPFQDEFLRTPDIPWPTAEDATVRVVGEGAGNMTYILVAQAGHFVAADQPALAKSIVEHWVQNVPFISS
ncbi:alpha/beta-hydrolase [Mycena capillaripes]|nr:alpha/beta-hydrolase [Mycena capillaripes]